MSLEGVEGSLIHPKMNFTDFILFIILLIFFFSGEVVCLPALMVVLHLITWQQQGRTANSVVTILFQGMHKHVISCGNCQHESASFEPSTVLSLALPVSGNSTLKRLLHNYYEDTVITYKSPQCSFKKTVIQKMPSILVLHLNRFE